MEVQDIAVGFREHNTRLVPLMLKRLHDLQMKARSVNGKTAEIFVNGSVEGQGCSKSVPEGTHRNEVLSIDGRDTDRTKSVDDLSRPFAHFGGNSMPTSPETRSPKLNGGLTKFRNTSNLSTLFEGSQHSSDCKYTRYTIPIYPVTIETSQMLTLRYLTSMGEYQEFLGQVFEHNAMQLIFRYIENLDAKNTCLAFEALKYLASLLCHKKFSLEFINNGGLEVIWS